ncbi:MAG: gliding motility-associated C-terminal domain-containing protein [Flavisolibacter sp.]|jgi:gliding motility-associated-like protein|nr:gliding motility-associated C-terminal domain-containing protein [Flavisolibacter sp.]
MKKLILCISIVFCTIPALADHLKGGFFTYEYLGPGITNPNSVRYRVRLTVYMACNPSSGQLNTSIPFTFFDANSNAQVQNVMVGISNQYNLVRSKDEECITGDQRGCYYTIVVYELASIELPSNAAGYTVSYQRCCRIIGIQNMISNPASNSVGNTYSITIPGSSAPQNAQTNNSAQFLVNDTAVVCGGSFFQIPFIATDSDGDSLSYSFCGAWTGGGQGAGSGPGSSVPNPAAPPPYQNINYGSGFSGSSPLGDGVTINAATGLISGVAPTSFGEYVVTVCVNEWRQGVLIASSRKELHLKVGDCNSIQANISINNQIIIPSNPQFINCKTYILNFANPTTGGVTSYFWDFGLPGISSDTSNLPNPTFLYPDTGTYNVKLIVNRGQACSDSATATIKLYPGFFAGFTYEGICLNNPTNFTDTTKTAYGTVNAWRWDFGDINTSADTSVLKNPSYTFTQAGIKDVRMIVRSSFGCVDTVIKSVEILAKPPLSVSFKDTLICTGDSVTLNAIGVGNFSWTPPNNIINAGTANPVVFPNTTTKYVVELNQNGCINTDTVQVRVVGFVTLQAMPDTTICLTDSISLYAAGNGLQYAWVPGGGLANPNSAITRALPAGTTTYTVTATIGSCSASEDVIVNAVPYPVADAGPDVIICFRSDTRLNGTIIGSSFTWSPSGSLDNPGILNPVAKPVSTTAYVLSAFDVLGCPKPGKDTVLVTVLPRIIPFAGNDTAVVAGQPLQFNASGGTGYVWSPGTGLSGTTIFNPIGLYTGDFDSIRYKVVISDEAGCSDSAFVGVKIFRTQPQVFVPSAFTPNRDGKNDLFRPIAVGLTQIEYFRVFNRWGQLVFSTNRNMQGWDGRISGKEQGTGTYVWLVKGIDFTGKTFFAKGTVTLIK